MSTSSTLQTVQASIAPGDNTSSTDNSLSRWIFERVKEFVSGRVLEVSNGAGHIAPYCSQINRPAEVASISLNTDLFSRQYEYLFGSIDTLIVLNSEEQVVNQRTVITNCAQLLKSEGHIIILLPACTALYNGLDQGYRKWKRDNLEFMHNILRTHFKILKTRYLMVTGDQSPPSSQRVSKYQERVSFFNKANALGLDAVGLSAVVVGKKR